MPAEITTDIFFNQAVAEAVVRERIAVEEVPGRDRIRVLPFQIGELFFKAVLCNRQGEDASWMVEIRHPYCRYSFFKDKIYWLRCLAKESFARALQEVRPCPCRFKAVQIFHQI